MNITSINAYQTPYRNNHSIKNNRVANNQINFKGDNNEIKKGIDVKGNLEKIKKPVKYMFIGGAVIGTLTGIGGYKLCEHNQAPRTTTVTYETFSTDPVKQKEGEERLADLLDIEERQVVLEPKEGKDNQSEVVVYPKYERIEEEMIKIREKMLDNPSNQRYLTDCRVELEKLQTKQKKQDEYGTILRNRDKIYIFLKKPISLDDFYNLYDVKENALYEKGTGKKDDEEIKSTVIEKGDSWIEKDTVKTENGNLTPDVVYYFDIDDETDIIQPLRDNLR